MSMLLRAARPRVLTLYSVFALTLGGYYLSTFIHDFFATGNYPWVTRVAVGATILLASLVPGAAVAFFLEFLGVSQGTHLLGRRLAFLSAVFGLMVAVSPLAQKEWARIVVGTWVLGALLASVSLLLRRVRTTDSRIERLRLTYRPLAPGRPSSSACWISSSATGCPSPPRWGPSSPRSTCSSSRRRCCGCG
ncbi:hypothetical protein ACN28S_16785 [Cystobacter fuscus]